MLRDKLRSPIIQCSITQLQELLPVELWSVILDFLDNDVRNFMSFARTCHFFLQLVMEKFNSNRWRDPLSFGYSDFYLASCYLNSIFFNIQLCNPYKVPKNYAKNIINTSAKSLLQRKASEFCTEYFWGARSLTTPRCYYQTDEFFFTSLNKFRDTLKFNKFVDKLNNLNLQKERISNYPFRTGLMIHIMACMMLSLRYETARLDDNLQNRLWGLVMPDRVFFFLRQDNFCIYLLPDFALPTELPFVCDLPLHVDYLEGDFAEGKALMIPLKNTNLRRANFGGRDLSGMNFEHANLENANLASTILHNTNFKNANLQEANLSRASLVGADFRGAKLTGANFRGAKFSETTKLQATLFADFSVQELNERFKLQQAIVPFADLML